MIVTVFIAIAAAFIGFIIGCIVDMPGDPTPVMTPTTAPKPKEEVHKHFVMSKVVMPKRIKEPEFNRRVNAALKEVVDKAVDLWVSGDNKAYKSRLASELYLEWHAKIDNATYRDYRPNLQRLNFIGRRVGRGFKFEAFWESKEPKLVTVQHM